MSAPVPVMRSVSERYEAMVAKGEIEADAAQRALVARLDRICEALGETRLARKSSNLGWLFGRRASARQKITGLYIWGEVGRGKSMLMDLFFQIAPAKRKRRVHFHEFMADVHDRVHAFRQALKRGEVSGDDPIPPLATALSRETRLLCFDEFSVTDIADAMILGRLFTLLFEMGVVVVATSNVAPDDLYRDGLNRDHFLGFISLLKDNVEVFRLDARTDYRMEMLSGEPRYFTPLDEDARSCIDHLWERISGGSDRAERLEVKGRCLEIPRVSRGAARISFADLCAKPLGAADYLRIAHTYHTVFIDDVPTMGVDKRNEAKRFIILIDALYDNHVRVVVTAAAPPDGLYSAASGTEIFEFARTASRLIEMQSEEYLSERAKERSSGA